MSYTSMSSPNTSRVSLSLSDIGVPVKPMYEAWGSELRILRAAPICTLPSVSIFSSMPYCPRWASSVITMMFCRSDSGPSQSSNFCMVVNMMPPELRFLSNVFSEVSSPSAFLLVHCTAHWRRKSTVRENCPYSCSSRSLRSVITTMVGFICCTLG